MASQGRPGSATIIYIVNNFFLSIFYETLYLNIDNMIKFNVEFK